MGIIRKAFSGLSRIISEESWKLPFASAGIFAAVAHPFASYYSNQDAQAQYPIEYLIIPALVGLGVGIVSELQLRRYCSRQQQNVIQMPRRDTGAA